MLKRLTALAVASSALALAAAYCARVLGHGGPEHVGRPDCKNSISPDRRFGCTVFKG
jgi:hypothetical protein